MRRFRISVSMIESNRIEFKRELTRELDIEREVIAFLNYREGGTIYIGIDDAGTPVGVQDIDSDMLKIKDRIRMGVFPSPMSQSFVYSYAYTPGLESEECFKTLPVSLSITYKS